jgi:undecaprenyl diphosphate synthase
MHVAIIMDGNGRWATRRSLPRTTGHTEGARVVPRIVESAAKQGVEVLTLYAFSSDNWGRPRSEVAVLMRLLRHHLQAEVARCVEQSVHLNVIGRRDRLAPALVRAIEEAERATRGGTRLHLRIAVDYSARDSLMEAARQFPSTEPDDRDTFRRQLERATHTSRPVPDVDLLIRTGGERRLSDFLLWECAYAELFFHDCLWPDFSEQAFTECLDQYRYRERRFGRVIAATA